jgi:hypothetical protein
VTAVSLAAIASSIFVLTTGSDDRLQPEVASATMTGPVIFQGLTLLRQDGTIGSDPSAGVIDGTLGMLNGCVAVPAGHPHAAVYVVFPPGYDLRGSGSSWEVVDARGDTLGDAGGDVRLWGVGHDLAFAEQHTQLPEACRQPNRHTSHTWWFVSASKID